LLSAEEPAGVLDDPAQAGAVDPVEFRVLLIASTFLLGFLHGLGADHLMAIAALSVGSVGETAAVRRTRALSVALRFAAGHALLLALGAGALIVLGWSLPLVVERGGELLGGSLLIALGGVGLWGVASGRVYGHTHPDPHQPHSHWHLHIGRQDRHPLPSAHTHLPTIVGAAFAISSLRALTLLAPFGDGAGRPALPLVVVLGLVAVFAVGILISMSLFGVALARLLSARALQRVSSVAAAVMAGASIALGIFWMASAVLGHS
jgi:nickel/cobalt exporter